MGEVSPLKKEQRREATTNRATSFLESSSSSSCLEDADCESGAQGRVEETSVSPDFETSAASSEQQQQQQQHQTVSIIGRGLIERKKIKEQSSSERRLRPPGIPAVKWLIWK